MHIIIYLIANHQLYYTRWPMKSDHFLIAGNFRALLCYLLHQTRKVLCNTAVTQSIKITHLDYGVCKFLLVHVLHYSPCFYLVCAEDISTSNNGIKVIQSY